MAWEFVTSARSRDSARYSPRRALDLAPAQVGGTSAGRLSPTGWLGGPCLGLTDRGRQTVRRSTSEDTSGPTGTGWPSS